MVAALIGAPVLCLAFVAVIDDTFTLTTQERVARQMGAADALVNWNSDTPVQQEPADPGAGAVAEPAGPPAGPSTPKTDERLLSLLPAGSRVSRVDTGGATVRMRTASGIGRISGRYADLDNPLTQGLATMLGGRAPRTAGEVALSPQAAERLGAKIGSSVGTLEPPQSYVVTGLVEFPDDLREIILFHPVAMSAAAAQLGGSWLVDVPGELSSQQSMALNQAGAYVSSRRLAEQGLYDPDRTEQFALGTLVVGLIVFEVVLLCGPAFAVGARRRRRELALVAANGGTAQQLRRIMLADGALLGLVGALPGVVLGVLAAVLGRPFLEEYLGGRGGALRLYPAALAGGVVLAILTGMLAALVPAISAARQDVVTALSGRRGIVRSRRRWIALGVLVAGLGAAAAIAGSLAYSSDIMLAGLVLGQLGFVILTPSLVGLIGRLGRVLPLAPRIALRDAARNRAAAAPAISAVMAVVAGSVMVGIYLFSQGQRDAAYYRQSLPIGYVAVRLVDLVGDDARPMDAAKTARMQERARQLLPVAGSVTVARPACGAAEPDGYCALELVLPPSQQCPFNEPPADPDDKAAAVTDPRCHEQIGWGGAFSAIVDDGTALAVMTRADADDLARAVEVLKSGGVVVGDPRYIVDGQVEIVPRRDDDKTGTEDHSGSVRLPAYALRTGIHGFDIAIGDRGLATFGFTAEPGYLVLATTRMPTDAEQDKFDSALLEFNEIASSTVERPSGGRIDYLPLALAVASALITLAAAAIATGLAAADGRADLATLGAVGASPRVRRLMSLSQSGVIAGIGTLLGIAIGVGGALALLAGINRSATMRIWPIPRELPLVVPWQQLVIAAVVPLVAMLGAGLLTRSRLPIERR